MAHFVICNHCCLNSGLLSGVSVSVPTSRRKVVRGTWETPATFGFGAEVGSASVQPPPRTSPCLSPSLGASRVGCGPCPTCGHAAQRSAEERAGGAATRAAEEERPKERGERSRRPRQSIGATTRWRKEEKRSKMANWSETMQRKTLDSRASVEQPVLHRRREQFAEN